MAVLAVCASLEVLFEFAIPAILNIVADVNVLELVTETAVAVGETLPEDLSWLPSTTIGEVSLPFESTVGDLLEVTSEASRSIATTWTRPLLSGAAAWTTTQSYLEYSDEQRVNV